MARCSPTGITGRYALDLHPDDIYWCTADPGWVTGTSYGIDRAAAARRELHRRRGRLRRRALVPHPAGPAGQRLVHRTHRHPHADEGRAGAGARFFLPRLRFVASVGEPLNPEAVWWGREVLGLPIHDNWWQTETGGIMIANTRARHQARLDGKAAARCRGGDRASARRRRRGVRRCEPDEEGELALKRGWPSMLRGYLNNEERYRKCFAGDWYLTGDLARRDADGYFWFVGRSDDVIKSAGHLIGPSRSRAR
jgi:acetyl-CoA synthetase